MTLILEYRDKIKKFYRMNAIVILPILRFLLAFIALNGVNTMMGYFPRLDTLAVVLVASLACSFLPAGCLVLLCALFSLGHLYALSLEALLVGVCVYLLIFLLLYRFAPSDSYMVILTPLFFAMKIPYVIPIAAGLLGGPLSAISVACGVIIYYVLTTMVGCAPTLITMGEKEYAEKIRFLLEKLLSNKAMLVIAAAFALTVVVTWVIRRMSVEHAWTIAIVAGAMVNLVVLLIGNLKYDIHLSLGSAIFGSILAVAMSMVILFFRFCLDYGRTEWVQFEDDEYYYYVKAVPKMTVAAPTKTVKKINASSGRPASSGRTAVAGRTAAQGKVAAQRKAAAQGRPSAQGNAQSRERIREAQRARRYEEGYEGSDGGDEMGQTRAMPQVRSTSQGRTAVKSGTGSQERGTRQVTVQSKRSVERSADGMTSGSANFGGSTRTVTTERVPRNDDASYRKQSSLPAKEITVGSNQMTENTEESDGYEELF
ncbi:MAG: hypothetical protein IK081_14380 [Lachnospiraceae bacterium]|nr:hypothetical protein [Lachnospiraceae bacterium]MBR4733945.1 hypothetical protein [Lachnospiraceae bacterium]